MAHTTPTTTRAAVLNAIELFDSLGRETFLRRFGFGPSQRYKLRFRGRSYDSKAILGVAAGMTAREFSGGAAHTVRVLGRLGFHVRDGQRAETPAVVRDLVAAEVGAFPFEPWSAGQVDPSAYFASGLNTAANIRAFAAIGHDIGVAYRELRDSGIDALLELAHTDVQVFVDSGAFSEVKFGPAGREVVAPITDSYWREYLATCERLALVLGDQLHIVAPDSVGDQAETIERLGRYAVELRRIEQLGARVLVPVQRGDLSQADFWRCCVAELGAGEWMPALPCRKSATTIEEAVAFVADVEPSHLHLLGLGTRNAAAGRWFDALAVARPGLQVQCDSCLLAATAGKGRRYGAARARAFELVESGKLAASVALRTMFQVALAFGVVVAPVGEQLQLFS